MESANVKTDFQVHLQITVVRLKKYCHLSLFQPTYLLKSAKEPTAE